VTIVRTVSRKTSIGGLYVCAEVLDILKIDKTTLIYSASYFNVGRLVALFGGSKPTKAPPVATGLNIVNCDLTLLFTRGT